MPRTRRARAALTLGALALTAALTACDDGSGSSDAEATDPAARSTSADEEGGSAADSPAGQPEWAPAVETDAEDSVTGLDFSSAPPEPSADLEFAVLREGDGPEIETGQTITANYYGAVYGSDTPFDESYSTEPFQAPIGVGRLIQGWDQTLPGVPVGSRVIMSIPPDQAYGDQDQGGIPGGSTLVFVIDVIEAS